ncbi:MAG: thioesterase [Candidatus Choladocola sp.]|nr:thioesterase [Candidatus Choladocola sp.]
MAYEFDSKVRYSEMDLEQKLTLVSLVDYFQDCSTFQSELCGHGIQYMKDRGRAWMILSWQIEILRRPRLGEKITARTWPYGFKAFYGYRNYALLDGGGAYLAKANSIWVLMDVESGCPAKIMPEDISGYTTEPELPMEKLSRKMKMPEESIKMEEIEVGIPHLDTNHHVNNGQYIRMAEMYLPEGFEPSRLRVEYRMQAHLHDRIVPMVHTEERTVTVGLCNTEGKPYAVVEYTR